MFLPLRYNDGVERRLDRILLERVASGCVAMMASLSVLTVASLGHGATLVAFFSALSQLSAGLAWLAIRRGLVEPRLAAPLSFLLWCTAEAAVLTALWSFRDMTQEIWLALLLWAYGAMQLKRGWFALAAVLGSACWASSIIWLDFPNSDIHMVSVAAAVGVAALSFSANHVVLIDLAQLRNEDVRRREELAAAVKRAEAELAERKEAEQESDKLREQFIAAQRMEAIGVLAGGVAHDMNNVLAGILGIAELRLLQADDREARDMRLIVEASERGASLTRALLGFSRRAHYRKTALTVESIINETRRIVERAIPKEISIVCAVDSQLCIEGDRGHLVQALVNLCNNAVHAMPDGGLLEITAELRLPKEPSLDRAPSAGPFAAISVSDEGCGMSQETRQRAFEPFFTTKAVGEGSGLGLAMVWGTCESHGGRVEIKSPSERGTTVELLLPLTKLALEGAPSETEHASSWSGEGHRVLIIDDEPLVRRALGRMLQFTGCEVVYGNDGIDGLERFAESAALDAVLLDLSMPRLNGAECYEQLRQRNPTIPIICMSGYARDTEAEDLIGKDVPFLQKPIEFNRLREALARAIPSQADESVELPSADAPQPSSSGNISAAQPEQRP